MTPKNTVRGKTRKRGDILNCKFGYIWPLGLHRSGYVKIIDPEKHTYVWADNKETLKTVTG